MDLLSHQARTGLTVAVTGTLLAVCCGAMVFRQKQIFTGAISSKHTSRRFLAMARASTVGNSCRACHVDLRTPDEQCMACHTETLPGQKVDEDSLVHNPKYVARLAHQGLPPTYEKRKKAKDIKDQAVRPGGVESATLPLSCSWCHREHSPERPKRQTASKGEKVTEEERPDITPVRQIQNPVCEVCHPKHHDEPTSRSLSKALFERSSPEAKKKFSDAKVLTTWRDTCVPCHNEHGGNEPGEGLDLEARGSVGEGAPGGAPPPAPTWRASGLTATRPSP